MEAWRKSINSPTTRKSKEKGILWVWTPGSGKEGLGSSALVSVGRGVLLKTREPGWWERRLDPAPSRRPRPSQRPRPQMQRRSLRHHSAVRTAKPFRQPAEGGGTHRESRDTADPRSEESGGESPVPMRLKD